MLAALCVALVAAMSGIAGILLGGYLRSREISADRKLQADALLSSLVAEIEADTRLIDHRQFLGAMSTVQNQAQAMINEGRGHEPAAFLQIHLSQDYMAVFTASVGKLGLLTPYQADRVVRFYTFLKAVQENYLAGSPFQSGVSAHAAFEILTNDIQLLQTIIVLGNHISATFRRIEPPPGALDPFSTDAGVKLQPALPTPEPSQADFVAGSSGDTARPPLLPP